MTRTMFSRISLFLGLIWTASLITPFDANGQFINIAHGYHQEGRVKQLITNTGSLTDWRGFPYYVDQFGTVFPIGSGVNHLETAGLVVGGITPKGDTLVSTSRSFFFNSRQELYGYSEDPNDGVFSFYKNHPNHSDFDPPSDYFYQSYEPFADEDFLTRYNDYNRAARQASGHKPLYLDVYQISYAWGDPLNKPLVPGNHRSRESDDSVHPLDNVIVINYRITPTKFPIKKLLIGSIINPTIEHGSGGSYTAGNADIMRYYHPTRQTVTSDSRVTELIGGSAIGTQLLPPLTRNQKNLNWTWAVTTDSSFNVHNDTDRYRLMASGRLEDDPPHSRSENLYLQSVGPFDLSVDDTLKFNIVLSLGKTRTEVRETGRTMQLLHRQNYHLPQPPPKPEVTVKKEGRKAIIRWSNNAESYSDPYRFDGSEKPFEGYRIYKISGDLYRQEYRTLLAEYDLAGNQFGFNTGLKYKYVDKNLAHLREYTYAVTAFSKSDTVLQIPSRESGISNVNSVTIEGNTDVHQNLDSVAVVPNPYRGDINYNDGQYPWEKAPPSRDRWRPVDRRVQFINLPEQATINIYTLSGRRIETLNHHGLNTGTQSWNLHSQNGETVSSGIYLYTVRNEENGEIKRGKFVVIL